jgi:hypothetical protein
MMDLGKNYLFSSPFDCPSCLDPMLKRTIAAFGKPALITVQQIIEQGLGIKFFV